MTRKTSKCSALSATQPWNQSQSETEKTVIWTNSFSIDGNSGVPSDEPWRICTKTSETWWNKSWCKLEKLFQLRKWDLARELNPHCRCQNAAPLLKQDNKAKKARTNNIKVAWFQYMGKTDGVLFAKEERSSSKTKMSHSLLSGDWSTFWHTFTNLDSNKHNKSDSHFPTHCRLELHDFGEDNNDWHTWRVSNLNDLN